MGLARGKGEGEKPELFIRAFFLDGNSLRRVQPREESFGDGPEKEDPLESISKFSSFYIPPRS